MLAFVEGLVVATGPQNVVINVHGLGFRVGIPSSTTAKIPDIGETVRLYTHLQVKEDGVALFGFFSVEEYELFVLLLSVAGIGPKAALSMLSHAPVGQIYLWILNEDVNQLKKMPGIGNKTAQRLILELKGKISGIPSAIDTQGPLVVTRGGSDLFGEAVAALCSLGYDGDEAARAVSAVMRETPDTTLEVAVKGALKQLARL